MSEKPKRIQRKRTKGWRMPQNTAYVGRGSRWGNIYRPGMSYFHEDTLQHEILTLERAIEMYRAWVTPHACIVDEYLRGKNLACWCPLDQPCHADVLLEIANQ